MRTPNLNYCCRYYDHWHQTEDDAGQPYVFTTASQLLDDFWREVKRAMKEKGILNDL